MATFPWARLYKNQGQNLRKFPHMSAWLKRIEARPAVKRALLVGKEERAKHNIATDKKAQSVLFGQRAR